MECSKNIISLDTLDSYLSAYIEQQIFNLGCCRIFLKDKYSKDIYEYAVVTRSKLFTPDTPSCKLSYNMKIASNNFTDEKLDSIVSKIKQFATDGIFPHCLWHNDILFTFNDFIKYILSCDDSINTIHIDSFKIKMIKSPNQFKYIVTKDEITFENSFKIKDFKSESYKMEQTTNVVNSIYKCMVNLGINKSSTIKYKLLLRCNCCGTFENKVISFNVRENNLCKNDPERINRISNKFYFKIKTYVEEGVENLTHICKPNVLSNYTLVGIEYITDYINPANDNFDGFHISDR
jgi:hypothetical protein